MKLRSIFKGREGRQDGKEQPQRVQCKVGWGSLDSLGYRFTSHPQDTMLMKQILSPDTTIAAFAEALCFPAVDALCGYRMSEQDADHQYLGFAHWVKDTEDGEKSYVLGIAIEALERGELYAAAVLAHELAHIEVDRAGGDITAHDDAFAKAVKRLVEQYEKQTGKSIPYDVAGEKIT